MNHVSYGCLVTVEVSEEVRTSSQVKVKSGSCKTLHGSVLTELSGGLHQAPGLTAPLPNNQVQHVGLQTVLQHLVQGWTQILQDEVTHVWTHPAVPQFSLMEETSGDRGDECLPKLTLSVYTRALIV